VVAHYRPRLIFQWAPEKQTRGILCRAFDSVDTAIEAGLAVQPSVIIRRYGTPS